MSAIHQIERVPLSLHSGARKTIVLGDTMVWSGTTEVPEELEVELYRLPGSEEPTIALSRGELCDDRAVIDLTPAEARALVDALQKVLGGVGR
ncbi:hypothetical protein ACFYOK_10875 [Microbispora bryophytorum]|uniref:hypothetical protein n=1 Tax=Microbispora bryophytorum TaxID=1460882 RepID=UPI0033F7F75C